MIKHNVKTKISWYELRHSSSKFAILSSLHSGLKVILNSSGRATSLPLGSPVERRVLQHFACDDRTVIPLLPGPQFLVRAGCTTGRAGWSLGRRIYWLHLTTLCNPMPKIMLDYRPDGRTRLGRSLKRLLDEAETGLSESIW